VFEPADYCTADLNGDGQIDFADLHDLINLLWCNRCVPKKLAPAVLTRP